jgi:hypothetical protein
MASATCNNPSMIYTQPISTIKAKQRQRP